MYIDLFSCILVSLVMSIYLSHECRERRSISIYIGLSSCVLVSFHVSRSLLTCRYNSSLSNVDILQVYLSREEFSVLLFFGLFSCILVSSDMSTYFKSIYCARSSLASYFLVSFHVYWSPLTCRYTSSLSNVDILQVHLLRKEFSSCLVFGSLLVFMGLFSCTLVCFHVYWYFFMYIGLFSCILVSSGMSTYFKSK